MATVVKDLGAVTAYAYAVAGGYSGTEAEFEALLGNIAEDLSEIENLSVTVTTLPAGSSATASYSNGVLSLGIPKGDKGDKGDTGATGATGPTGNGISTITKTGTSGLVDTYTITFTNGDTTTFTVTNGEDGEVTTAQMNAAIETALEDYAKVTGDRIGEDENNIDGLYNAVSKTILSESFSQSVSTQDSYKVSHQISLAEGTEYSIEIDISTIAGGGWSTSSYPTALKIYLSNGNVGPTSQYIKRTFISSESLSATKHRFTFVASANDASANYLCVYTQIKPTGTFSGSCSIDSLYNIPNKIDGIDGLVYFSKNDSHGTWTQGTIDSSNGAIGVRSDRIADPTFYDGDEIDSVSVGASYDLLYGLYETDDTTGFVSVSSWVKSASSPFAKKYLRFAVRKSGGGNISTSEDTGFTIVYKKTSVKSVVEELYSEEPYSPYKVGSKNQVARLGWKVYSSNTPPEQSLASYALAYKNHARVMLCDVRVTADGEYICWHDADLGAELGTNTVRHSDGTELSTAEKEQLVNTLTLEQLNAYDYGLYKGAEYAGTKMLTLFDFIKWCALANCIPMIEIKVQLTSSQISEIATVIKAVGLSDRVIIDDYQSHFANNLNDWLSELPNATICVIAGTGYDTAITMCRTVIDSGNKALITLSTSSQLSQIQDENGNLDMSKVSLATDYGIGLSYTELTNDSALLEFYNGGYMNVFSYIACRTRLDNWIASKIGI